VEAVSQEQLVEAYLRGDVSRRTFIRRLVGGGISLTAAIAYTHALSPKPAAAAPPQFYEDQQPPGVETGDATGVGGTSATLNGKVDPNLQATKVAFEYGLTAGYGAATQAQDVGSGNGDQPVSQPVSGLLSGQLYHYRIVASNGSGISTGQDKTFTTPDVVTPDASASGLGQSVADVLRTGKIRVRVQSNEATDFALLAYSAAGGAAAAKRRKKKPFKVAKGRASLPGPGRKRATLKLSARGRRLLRKRRHKGVSLSLVVTARDRAGNRKVRRKRLRLHR
jgi:hypothetical protein